MIRIIQFFAASAALALSAFPVGAQILSFDDGTAENSIGITGSISVAYYLNSFPATAGVTQISGAQIAFGSPGATNVALLNGRTVNVFLWSDPNNDGSPTDAQVLASSSGTITLAGTNTFLSFVLPSTIVGTNNFFIGFEFITPAVSPDLFPAAIDTTAPNLTNRSFASFTTGNTTPFGNNLASGTLGSIESFGLPGNWLIRADTGVVAVPEPATVLGGVLAAGLMGWSWKRRTKAS